MIRIIVNDIPPSNNAYMGNSHSFRAYNAKKQEWHWLVRAAVKCRPESPYTRAEVRIIYYFPDSRRRDPDNYSGKFILDALVKERLIIDDSFDVINLKLNKGGVDKVNPRTIIEVEEME